MKSKYRTGQDLAPLFRQIFSIKLLSMALVFCAQVLLARLLGAAAYGEFAYALVVIAVLGWMAKLGLVQTLIKYVSIYAYSGQLDRLKGLLKFASRRVLHVTALSLAISGIIAVSRLDRVNNLSNLTVILIILHIPLVLAADLRLGVLRGLNAYVHSELPENILRPVLLMFWVIVGWQAGGLVHGVYWLLIGSLVISIINVALGGYWLQQNLPREMYQVSPKSEYSEWNAMAMSMVVLGGCQLFIGQLDLLVVGSLLDPSLTGVYAVSARIADLLVLGSLVTSGIVGPLVAQHWHEQELENLRKVVSSVSRVNSLFAISVAVAAITMGEWILSLFGSEFTAGYTALLWLLAGKICFASVGAMLVTLTMVGGHRKLARIMLLSVAVGSVLILGLTRAGGIGGAAMGTSVMLVFISLMVWVHYHKVVATD